MADRSISARWPRIVVGALVGAAVAAVLPTSLYLTAWDDSRHFTADWPFPIAFFAAPFLGPYIHPHRGARMDRTDWVSGIGTFAFVMTCHGRRLGLTGQR